VNESSRAEELFRAALPKMLEERAAFLDAVCAGDADLRQRIDKLFEEQANTRSAVAGRGTKVETDRFQRLRRAAD
jgi:hypothetical protein